jgi:hypothetical protein
MNYNKDHENDTDDNSVESFIIEMDSDFQNCNEIEPSIPKVKTNKIIKKIILKDKQITSKLETPKPETPKPEPPKHKTTKEEEKFEFNEETINFFTKDLNPKKILIKHPPNSPYLEKFNDTIIICLLIKIGHFKEYNCITPKCKVGKLWNGKPIQLILNRKNSIQHDLTLSNLDLICANCFMVTYGLDIFIKKKKEAILNCSLCEFPLVKFKDGRKKTGFCISCEYKMKQITHNKQEDNYFNKLKDTYSDNPVLSDNIKQTHYYSEVSKYNNFDKNKTYSNTNSNTNNNSNKKESVQMEKSGYSQPPIIELNMNLPDLSDLINDGNDGNDGNYEDNYSENDHDNDNEQIEIDF